MTIKITKIDDGINGIFYKIEPTKTARKTDNSEVEVIDEHRVVSLTKAQVDAELSKWNEIKKEIEKL